MSIEVFEARTTRELTWTGSTAPNAPPLFSVFDQSSTLIVSLTSVESDSTHYAATVTMPATPGYFVAEWLAVKTFNGSIRNWVNRKPFQVKITKPT